MRREFQESVLLRAAAILLLIHIAVVAFTTLTTGGAELGPDGARYLEMARAIRANGVFHEEAFAGGGIPPLWPIVIAASWTVVDEDVQAIRVLNLVFWVAAMMATYAIIRANSENTFALVGTLTFALHETYHFAKYAQYELLLTALTALAFLLWLRAMSKCQVDTFVLPGILWGLATLVQPRVLPIPFLLWAVAGVTRRLDRTRLQGNGLCVLVILLVLLPYAFRNWMVVGRWTPVSGNFGTNLLIGNNPNATGKYMEPDGPRDAGQRNVYALDSARGEAAIKWIADNPGTVLFRLVPLKMYHLWRLDKIANWLLILPVLWGMRSLWLRGYKLESVSFACILAYTAAIHALFFGEGRFRFFVLPFFHACVAEFVRDLFSRWHNESRA